MRRGSRFLIGFAAAALTFSSLMAFVGPRHFGGYRHHFGRGRHHCQVDQRWENRHHRNWGDHNGSKQQHQTAPQPNNNSNNKNQ